MFNVDAVHLANVRVAWLARCCPPIGLPPRLSAAGCSHTRPPLAPFRAPRSRARTALQQRSNTPPPTAPELATHPVVRSVVQSKATVPMHMRRVFTAACAACPFQCASAACRAASACCLPLIQLAGAFDSLTTSPLLTSWRPCSKGGQAHVRRAGRSSSSASGRIVSDRLPAGLLRMQKHQPAGSSRQQAMLTCSAGLSSCRMACAQKLHGKPCRGRCTAQGLVQLALHSLQHSAMHINASRAWKTPAM